MRAPDIGLAVERLLGLAPEPDTGQTARSTRADRRDSPTSETIIGRSARGVVRSSSSPARSARLEARLFFRPTSIRLRT